jgi:hypothetical protein
MYGNWHIERRRTLLAQLALLAAMVKVEQVKHWRVQGTCLQSSKFGVRGSPTGTAQAGRTAVALATNACHATWQLSLHLLLLMALLLPRCASTKQISQWWVVRLLLLFTLHECGWSMRLWKTFACGSSQKLLWRQLELTSGLSKTRRLAHRWTQLLAMHVGRLEADLRNGQADLDYVMKHQI